MWSSWNSLLSRDAYLSVGVIYIAARASSSSQYFLLNFWRSKLSKRADSNFLRKHILSNLASLNRRSTFHDVAGMSLLLI